MSESGAKWRHASPMLTAVSSPVARVMPSSTQNILPPEFQRLAWSNLAAQSAEQIALAAAPLYAVLVLGAGAGATGLIQTAQTLPFLLFAIPFGMLADRLSRRDVMMWAEAGRAAAILVTIALAWAGALTWPLLALLGLVGACGTVAYSVTAPALVPSLVPAASLGAANARIELARTVAFTAGPAAGGALVGWSGAQTAFACAAALSLAAVLSLAQVREPVRRPPQRRHPLQEIREGARFVFGHALLRPVFITQFIFGIAAFLLLAVFVPYAVQSLGMSAPEVGLVLGAYGLGMVCGALSAGQVVRRFRFGTVVAIGPVCGLAASLVMASTLVWPSAWLAAGGFFLLGWGPIIWVISTTTLRQTVTPSPLLGRVSAINIMAYGARPIGAGLGALIGAVWGPAPCIVVAAIGFAVQAGVILASPAARLVALPASANQATG